MRFFNNLFVNSLIPLVSCGVIVKRGVGSIDDFTPYPDVKKVVEANIKDYNYNFYSIFKDGPIYTGEATAYGMETTGGNCSFPKDEYYQDMMYAALNSKQYINDLGIYIIFFFIFYFLFFFFFFLKKIILIIINN